MQHPSAGWIAAALLAACALCVDGFSHGTPVAGVRARMSSLWPAKSSRSSSIVAPPGSVPDNGARNARSRGASTLGMVMMGDGRDLQGGEDQDQGSQGIMGGKSADVGSIWVEKLKDGEDKQNMSVSEMSLMCIWLEKKMSKEVLRENFEAAASIKGEIIKIHNKSLLMLEKKILSAASDMRNEIANQRKDSLKSIEMDYERAVAEDDFETACKLAKEKRDEVAKRKRMGMANPSRLFQTVDSYWLEGEINSKINLLRQQQAVLMQDPIVRLKHEMEKATNMGDIKAAAKAAEMLKQEQHKVDVERMQKKLESECKFKRIEEENLKKNDVVAYLESRLDQQVKADDFEAANETKEKLAAARFTKTIEDVSNRTRIEAESLERMGAVYRLKEDLAAALEVEDFAEAQRIRDEVEARDEAERLSRELHRAHSAGNADEVCMLTSRLVEAYIDQMNPRMLRDLGYKGFTRAAFNLGDVVTTKAGFRGVIVAADDKCMASDEWCARNGVERLKDGKERRFYHVIPDLRDAKVTPRRLWKQQVPSSKDCEYGIVDIDPAFLLGMSKRDKSPQALTAYVSESDMTKFDHDKPPEPGSWFLSNVIRSVIPESPISNTLVSKMFFSYSRGRYLYGGTVRDVTLFQFPSETSSR